jgi:hypothetical protein
VSRPRDLFIPTTWDSRNVITHHPDFGEKFVYLIRPTLAGNRWYLTVIDVSNSEIFFVDPFPDNPSEALEAIKQATR